MKVRYLGHAAVEIEHAGARALIDPFITGNPHAPVDATDLHPTHILLTHGHGDHLGDTVELATRHDATVVAAVELAEWLAGQGVANTIGINMGGGVTLPFGRVSLHPAWHSSSLPDGTYAGMPGGLLIEGEHLTLYHAGDTALFSDLGLLQRHGIDVAFVPIGDRYTMGPNDAVEAVRLLDPKHVVPIHFGTFPAIEQDPALFQADVHERTDARCVVMKPGQVWESNG